MWFSCFRLTHGRLHIDNVRLIRGFGNSIQYSVDYFLLPVRYVYIRRDYAIGSYLAWPAKQGKHVAKWRADRGTNDPLQSNAQLPANPWPAILFVLLSLLPYPRVSRREVKKNHWHTAHGKIVILWFMFCERGKKKENRKKEKYLESWALDSIRSLVYITTTRGKVKKDKKKKRGRNGGKVQSYERNLIDGGAFRSCCNSSMTRDPRHSMA